MQSNTVIRLITVFAQIKSMDKKAAIRKWTISLISRTGCQANINRGWEDRRNVCEREWRGNEGWGGRQTGMWSDYSRVYVWAIDWVGGDFLSG